MELNADGSMPRMDKLMHARPTQHSKPKLIGAFTLLAFIP